jgi:transcriptional regulator with XRE-family HTH domain
MVRFVPVTSTPGSTALGNALRKAREEAYPGKEHRGSMRRLAAQLGYAHTTISQWESGKRIPQPESVAKVLTALHVTGERFDHVMAIARRARDANWVTTGIPGVSHAFQNILKYERTCHTLTAWSPMIVPGLFQTGDYARAIMGASELPESELGTRVTLRVGRRDALTRKNAPTMLSLLGEQALRQNVGGPEVMAGQLRSILSVSELPNVTVQVVPIGIGWHDGLSGPFVLYVFPDAGPVVLLEHHRTSLFVSDDDDGYDVRGFMEAAEGIRHAALGVEDSCAMIAGMVEEMESA